MRWKFSDLMTGLFVLGGLALIIAILVIVRGQLDARDSYRTYFSNVSGLQAGAAVVYEGYIIGEVAEITPERLDDGMRFRVDLEVEKDWLIPSDSRAMVAALSLLSAQSIQIEAGTAAPLAPGAEIASDEAGNLMAELGRSASQLSRIAQENLVPLLEVTTSILDGEARQALAGISTISSTVGGQTPQLFNDIDTIMENLKTASQGAADLTGPQTQNQVNTLLSQANQAGESLVAAAQTGKQTIADTNMMVRDANTFLADRNQQVAQILQQINEASTSLNRSTQQIEKIASDQNIAAIDELLSAINTMQADLLIAAQAIRIASENAATISDIGEDRMESFLQRLESSALNVEELTARLRDDPSIIIRGTR